MLAELEFGDIIGGGAAQTAPGREMLGRYKAAVLAQPDSYAMVAGFLSEARHYAYDKGIMEAATRIADFISEHKASWALAGAVERIEADDSPQNFLNRSCVGQIKSLLEMSEPDVVRYIKAGALKNCNFIPAVRQVCKNVLQERKGPEEEDSAYTVRHPMTFTEAVDGGVLFNVGEELWIVKDGQVERTNERPSHERSMINMLMRSCTECRENHITCEQGGMRLEITPGRIIRECAGRRDEFTVDAWRETASMHAAGWARDRHKVAAFMEAAAIAAESFASLCENDLLTEYASARDIVRVLDGGDTVHVSGIKRQTGEPYSASGNIAECVKYIQAKTGIDLTGKYRDRIDEAVEQEEERTGKLMAESVEIAGIANRRERIMELTEMYKNDPVKLAVLSRLAMRLNDID